MLLSRTQETTFVSIIAIQNPCKELWLDTLPTQIILRVWPKDV
jgi:hypothetical protein